MYGDTIAIPLIIISADAHADQTLCGAGGGQDTDPNGPWVQGLTR